MTRRLLNPNSFVPLVIGVGFCAAAIFPLFLIGKHLFDWQSKRSWTAVEATVVDLAPGGDDDGARLPVDRIWGYRYSVDGVEHVGEVLMLAPTSPSDDSFAEPLRDELRAAHAEGRRITVFVDPTRPASAIYNRDLLLLDIMGLSVAAVVFGLPAIYSLWRYRRVRANEAIASRVLQPARRERFIAPVDASWGSPEIPPDSDSSGRILVMVAALLGSVAIVAATETAWELQQPLGILVGGAAIGAIGCSAIGIRRMHRRRLARGSLLRLDPFPSRIGGSLGGELVLAAALGTVESIIVRVRCIRGVFRSTSVDTGTWSSTEDLWSDTLRPTVASSVGESARIPFRVPIPAGLPESTGEGVNPSIEWKVEARAVTATGRHSLGWSIPVFVGEPPLAVPHGPSKQPVGEESKTSKVPELSEPWMPERPWGSGEERPSAEGLTIEFPSHSSLLAMIPPVVLGLTLGAALWFIPGYGSGQSPPLLFRIVAVTLLPPFIGLIVCSSHIRLTTIVDREAVRTRWSLFGITVRRINVPRARILGVAPYRDQGVVMRVKDGGVHVVVRALEGASASRYAAETFAHRGSLPLLPE